LCVAEVRCARARAGDGWGSASSVSLRVRRIQGPVDRLDDLQFHPALESSVDWFRLEKEIASALRVGRWGQILIVILPLHCPGTAVNCIYSCTATYSLLALATVPRSTPSNENFHFSSTISPPHIDGNLLSSAFERRTVSFHQVQFSLPFGGSKSRSSIFRTQTGRYNFVVLHVHICHNSYSFTV
jgi:hypothetical protein